MPILPWKQSNNNSDTDEATAMLTFLPLKNLWDTPRFVVYVVRIYLQLKRTPGVIGFTFKAQPLSKKYWTLSLWESEQAIGKYIHSEPHSDIMKKMASKMNKTSFVSWQVKETKSSLKWEDALSRMN